MTTDITGDPQRADPQDVAYPQDVDVQATRPAHHWHGWMLPSGLALALMALVGGLLLGKGMTDRVARVSDPVSLGFVRDMSTHHAQAVRMSEVAHRRSPDPEINYLAFDVLSTQQGQIGIMAGWLELSEQDYSGRAPTMAWMGHTGPMPGMATDRELTALDSLPIPQMEEQFLRLMIRHHRGAVPMAEAAAARAGNPHVAAIAAKMSAGQQAEVDLMQRMLVARGHEPEPGDTSRSSETAFDGGGGPSGEEAPSLHRGH